jgi:hypothetical protein
MLIVLCVLSLAIGNVVAIAQTNLKPTMTSASSVGTLSCPPAPTRIVFDEDVRARLCKGDAPDGWVGLSEAARRLCVSKPQAAYWVKTGKLPANLVHPGTQGSCHPWSTRFPATNGCNVVKDPDKPRPWQEWISVGILDGSAARSGWLRARPLAAMRNLRMASLLHSWLSAKE